jgi:hypothetical protein
MDTQFSQLIWAIAKSHLTKALTAAASALVTYGVISDDQVVPLVTGTLAFLISSALTIYQRYRDQVEKAIAARLPGGGVTTPSEVKEAAKVNTTPLANL